MEWNNQKVAGKRAAGVRKISVEAPVLLPIFIQIRLVWCQRPNLPSTGSYSFFGWEPQEASKLDEIKLLILDHLYFFNLLQLFEACSSAVFLPKRNPNSLH